MLSTKSQQNVKRPTSSPAVPPSRALEWLWQFLRDIRQPHILVCSPVYQSTVNLLLKRGAKLYMANPAAALLEENGNLWLQIEKTRIFQTDEFLRQFPAIPAESLSSVFCWHLLDLIPREALPVTLERLWSFLQPNGVLFSLLRETNLDTGAECNWWFDTMTTFSSSPGARVRFPYPVITNREIEKLIPSGNVKTFLTRGARREVLAIK